MQTLEHHTSALIIRGKKIYPHNIPVPTRQQMVDRVKEGYDYLAQDKEMVQKSFEVCGITSSDPERVRSGEFFQKCMEKAHQSLDAEDDEENDDPFS